VTSWTNDWSVIFKYGGLKEGKSDGTAIYAPDAMKGCRCIKTKKPQNVSAASFVKDFWKGLD